MVPYYGYAGGQMTNNEASTIICPITQVKEKSISRYYIKSQYWLPL